MHFYNYTPFELRNVVDLCADTALRTAGLQMIDWAGGGD